MILLVELVLLVSIALDTVVSPSIYAVIGPKNGINNLVWSLVLKCSATVCASFRVFIIPQVLTIYFSSFQDPGFLIMRQKRLNFSNALRCSV